MSPCAACQAPDPSRCVAVVDGCPEICRQLAAGTARPAVLRMVRGEDEVRRPGDRPAETTTTAAAVIDPAYIRADLCPHRNPATCQCNGAFECALHGRVTIESHCRACTDAPERIAR